MMDFLEPKSFEDFRSLAKNNSLTKNEKIGFPDSYREGFYEEIFTDIRSKLKLDREFPLKILDIGSGIGELPMRILEFSREMGHKFICIDSKEMNEMLPKCDKNFVKVDSRFPDCKEFIDENLESFDSILVYSVIQYALAEGLLENFINAIIKLLAPGGWALIGDIPNISMRNRFFESDAGIIHHNLFSNHDGSAPPVIKYYNEGSVFDDKLVLRVLEKSRSMGFNSFVVPQNSKLPMSNRREDILIHRP